MGKGNTLHLKDANYETAGEYICEVTVPSLPALHTSGSVHIIVQGQSVARWSVAAAFTIRGHGSC